MLGWIFTGAVLGLGSFYDRKSLCLPLWLLVLGIAGGMLGLLGMIWREDVQGWQVLMSLLPGILSLGLSFVTKEQIGYGDGLLLLMLGGCLGGKNTVQIWMSGLMVAFVIGAVLLVLKKAGKDSRLPFAPCLLIGHLFIGIGGWFGWG